MTVTVTLKDPEGHLLSKIATKAGSREYVINRLNKAGFIVSDDRTPDAKKHANFRDEDCEVEARTALIESLAAQKVHRVLG